MKWSDLPFKPTSRMLRQFAAGWLVVFLALALRQALFRGHTPAGWILGALACIGVVGLLKPPAIRWLFIGATLITFPIGWVVTNVMLAVMFYLVLTPLALLFRLRGRDALHLRRRTDRSSFWQERGDPPEAGRYLRQF